VFRFEYIDTDYEQWLHHLAHQLNVPVRNHLLEFPHEVGSGYCRIIKLPNGLQVCVIECTLNKDLHIHRKRSQEEFYTLHFDEITIAGSLQISIGDEKVKEKGTNKALAYLTSSLFDWSYHATKGSVYKGINILIKKQWLTKNLDMASAEEILNAYISLKAENINIEPLDARYRRWMKKACHVENDHPLRLIIIQNRIMLMLERFFTNLYEKMRNPAFRVPLSADDIGRVMSIERLLTKNIFNQPPSIQQLARMAAISESKLKKDFKTMYGFPIYEYYQKARMQAAQDKLLTGKYSVKEVAMELGYSNLSNFTIAFKKEFGILPSQLLSTRRPNE
jgi:AraC-like DNA-binding protein